MKFDLYKTITLEDLGEEWKDSFLKFSVITVGEAKNFASIASKEDSTDEIIGILKKKFVSGKVMSEGKLVDITKDQLDDLPLEIFKDVVESLTMFDSKKK